MPVTARLSKLFYDRFGDEIVGELVDWFNQVDATYRSDLRELNELNFARFDAKLEQRVAQLEAKIEQRIARLEAHLEQRIAELDTRLNARIDTVAAELHAVLERRLGEQTRWLFIAWTTIMMAVVGLWFRR